MRPTITPELLSFVVTLCQMALIGLGYRSLSVSPSAVGPVKAMLLELNAGKVKELLDQLIVKPVKGVSIRETLTKFAEAEGLPL